ncbi:hypothetical protein [Psychroserpens ponticola]|uniref:Gliding motility lipoprotein GldH n=1 Tax=Psychroserpens ponticola TaxID=2932268 RepID=A0ABY7RU34_9FLAO|nr:hypothetical protein [Psychroserpens ponticola]WCO00246.1 hypothetical protein MUN68_009180 [Psychroserpens ponticola]
MKRLFFLFLILSISCSKSDDSKEGIPECQEKMFLESFIAEPNDCFIFLDDPVMTFIFVRINPFTKTDFNNIPHAEIFVSIFIDDFTWEFLHTIYEDSEMNGNSFSGLVNGGINDNIYTIYFDEIEFTETETQFIFHRATIRLEKYVED